MGNVLIDDKAPLISIVVPVYKAEMFFVAMHRKRTAPNLYKLGVDSG